MKSENKYIGDDKFKKFLEHYACPAPLEVIKMRFAGAICSPNLELRPADVIASFWPENKSPRLETKNEADLFFKFFMGLWDEIFINVQENKLKLAKFAAHINLADLCIARYEQLEAGFIEGFWGGADKVNIPAYVAEIVDSLSRLALLYKSLADKSEKQQDSQNIADAVKNCDKTAEKSISFVIENFVLPRIENLRRKVN